VHGKCKLHILVSTIIIAFFSLTGAYIKLKDISWAPVIESFLGPFLRSYCVDSSHDAAVLTQIFSEVLGEERKPAINTSRFFDKVCPCACVKNQNFYNLFSYMFIFIFLSYFVYCTDFYLKNVECLP
jgi:hypothetical protein